MANTTCSLGNAGREVTVSVEAIKKLSEGAEKETLPIRLQKLSAGLSQMWLQERRDVVSLGVHGGAVVRCRGGMQKADSVMIINAARLCCSETSNASFLRTPRLTCIPPMKRAHFSPLVLFKNK